MLESLISHVPYKSQYSGFISAKFSKFVQTPFIYYEISMRTPNPQKNKNGEDIIIV